MTSQENVEVVRRALGAWNAGDMDALWEVYGPDVIMRSVEGWPEPGPFMGRDAVMRQWERLREAFEADILEPVGEFIGLGDRVVARHAWRGAGRGPEMNMEVTTIYTVRKQRVVHQEFFWNHSEALDAVGVSE